MFPRSLRAPERAFFLFGPRGTGKSAWLRTSFPGALSLDLLPPATALRFERAPELLRAEVLAQPRERWIVLDEVQRVPALLDEVHRRVESEGYRRFAMSGSSARKLRRGQANLLAGRAVVRHLRPLTAAELGFSVPGSSRLRHGSLPLSVTAATAAEREDFLRAYVTLYLSEEIRAEGGVRQVGSFARFLEVAALSAGRTTNVSAIARDAQVSRETVRGWFDVLVDTLIGSWLPAFRPRGRAG